MNAWQYIQRELEQGRITDEHIEEMTRLWQRSYGLEVDGMPGPDTRRSIAEERTARLGPAPLPTGRVHPLRALADGREPEITSDFHSRNRSRPTHNGVDLFYPYNAKTDPAMKVGDGGRTSKWWIPDGTIAIAGAAGEVTAASKISTGFRVWIDVGSNWRIGYFHLAKLLVKVGDVLELGAPVGIVGDSPAGDDARHLHFELGYGPTDDYKRGVRDPLAWLTGAKVLAAS